MAMISSLVEVKHFSQEQIKPKHIQNPVKSKKNTYKLKIENLYFIHIQIPLINYWQHFSIKLRMFLEMYNLPRLSQEEIEI